MHFVLHLLCADDDYHLIVEESRTTAEVLQREWLERRLCKAVDRAMSDNGFSRRRGGLTSESFIESKVYGLSSIRRPLHIGGSASLGRPKELNAERTEGEGGGPTARNSRLVCSRLVSGESVILTPTSSHKCPPPRQIVGLTDKENYRPNIFAGTSSDEDLSLEESKQTKEPETSPFSNAFFDKPRPASCVLKKGTSPAVLFDDAFFDDCKQYMVLPPDKQPLRRATVAAEVLPLTSTDTEETQKDHLNSDQLQWTRTRVRALESQIASIIVDTVKSFPSNRKKISLSKSMLANAEVISQVDAKFIVINAGGVLCIVDQHAADERVSLERLERELLSRTVTSSGVAVDTSSSEMIKSLPLLPAQQLRLSSSQLTTVLQHKDLLEKWRFMFRFHQDKKGVVLLSGVPGIFHKVATAKDFLQFSQALGNRTSDAGLIKPAFVKRVLASYSCRYAIMFGDVLTEERSKELIRSLSLCHHCFICAHGRPSIVPLLDMNTLPNYIDTNSTKQNQSSDSLYETSTPLRFQYHRRHEQKKSTSV